MGFNTIEIFFFTHRLVVMEGGMGGSSGLMAQYQRAAA